MNWYNVTWWFFYILIAIGLQQNFPGLDFLLPGFIIAVQERNVAQVGWVGLFFILLQEGLGSLAFGGTIMWYLLAIVWFFIAYNLFEVESFLFIFLLSGILATMHLAVFYMIASLQNIPVNNTKIMEESVYQALMTPFVWWAAQWTRKFVPHEDPA